MSEKPNVLWIILDSLRADHISSYGYSRNTTPHLDRLAENGVIFTQAISPGTGSPSVHTSWLTGLYPSEHGIWGGPNIKVSPNLPLLSELMCDAGYLTAGFSTNLHFGKRYGLDRGFSSFLELQDQRKSSNLALIYRCLNKMSKVINHGRADWGEKNHSKLLAEVLVSWINQNIDAQPFFILCNFMETHVPHKPPWKFLTKFVTREDGWRNQMNLVNHLSVDAARYISGKSGITDDDMRLLLDLYDAEIAFIDDCIGNIMHFLEQKGLLENTLIIITADHGDFYGEHGLIMHNAFLYDELIRVPLIMKLPNVFEGGIICAKQISTLSLSRTVLEFAGVDVYQMGIRGESLSSFPDVRSICPIVFSEGKSPGDLFKRIQDFNPDYGGPNVFSFKRSVRTTKYKYIWDSERKDEFFSLQDDPKEKNNLITTNHPMKKSLRDNLDQIVGTLKQSSSIETNVFSPEEEREIENRLKSLGYLS